MQWSPQKVIHCAKAVGVNGGGLKRWSLCREGGDKTKKRKGAGNPRGRGLENLTVLSCAINYDQAKRRLRGRVFG